MLNSGQIQTKLPQFIGEAAKADFEVVYASARDGCLFIECGEAYEDRGNVWSKQAFSSPYYFEFRYRKLSGRKGLNLIFYGLHNVNTGSNSIAVARLSNPCNILQQFPINACPILPEDAVITI